MNENSSLLSLLGIKATEKQSTNSCKRESMEDVDKNNDQNNISSYLDIVWEKEIDDLNKFDLNEIKEDSSVSSGEDSNDNAEAEFEATNEMSEEEEGEENIKGRWKNRLPKYEKDDKRISSDEVWQYVTDVDCKPNNYTNGKVICKLCDKSLRFQGADHHLASLHR